MTSAPTLQGRVHQNLYVPADSRRVEALIDVDAIVDDTAAPATATAAAEVIVIDTSGSMLSPIDKIIAAKQATKVAIDTMRDGVHFAVIAGSETTRMIYPVEESTATADAQTRAAAKAAVDRLIEGGGTAIAQWLALTARLLARHPDAIRHAILLTDGQNNRPGLETEVEACAGKFRCDCRGVGDDWSAAELLMISRKLGGSVERIADPATLAEDFRKMMTASMRKEVAEIDLRVWTPESATIELVKQRQPDNFELRRCADDGKQVSYYATGAWGAEQRDFHIAVTVPPAAVNQERLAFRISFVQRLPDGTRVPLRQTYFRTRPDGTEECRPEAMVSAIWTDDPGRDTDLPLRVRAGHDQQAVEEAARLAIAAYQAGDHDRAAEQLLQIRPVAERAGMTALVERIDDLIDPETGTGRFTPGDMLDIEIESSRISTTSRTDRT